MTRTTIGLVVAMAAAALLAYCPLASADEKPAERSIEVQGHGESRATPDTAMLDLAIETHGSTAEEAATQNADLSQKVVKALKDKLGDKGKIWTGGYNLFPIYEEHQTPDHAKIIGYRAENSISVETGALDVLGTLIDTAIGAGANRVNSLNFSLRDDSNARGDAIGKASKDAQAQAQALSNALGVKLKKIVTASTVSQVRPMPVYARAMAMPMAAEGAPTPVSPGEVTVPATVSLTYEIE